MSDVLFQEIRGFEEYQAARQEELHRFSEELTALEKARDAIMRQVELDNGNAEARRDLEKSDKQVAELKKRIANHTRWTRGRVQNLRTKILQTQERALKAMQEDMDHKHAALAELRTVLIPEAEQHLADLRERVGQIENEMKEVQDRVRKINKLNLDVLFQD